MYTQNWFKITAKSNFKRFLIPIYKNKEFNYLEIGCFEGMATCWILKNFSKAQVFAIDTFEGGAEHKGMDLSRLKEKFIQNTKLWKDRVHLLIGRSIDILRTNRWEQFFDVIYIDGSHIACDVLSDAVLSWFLLKQGGLIIFDDYKWYGGESEIERPKLGIDSFLACFKNQYEILEKKYQIIIKKNIIEKEVK